MYQSRVPKGFGCAWLHPGCSGVGSYSRRLVVERMREAFEESKVGKSVEIVDAAPKPALAFGHGRDDSDGED